MEVLKDRIAKYILESAEQEGLLERRMIIIEATSGNTGIGLCLAGVQKGYRVICVMPENVSEERKKIIQAFGGETIFTPAEESLAGCLQKMREITQPDPPQILCGQSVRQSPQPRDSLSTNWS